MMPTHPSFDPDHPGDLPSDHEFEFTLTDRDIVTVLVSKVGGGTVGRSYRSEYWHFTVTVGGAVTDRGTCFVAGSTTHAEAASLLRDNMNLAGKLRQNPSLIDLDGV